MIMDNKTKQSWFHYLGGDGGQKLELVKELVESGFHLMPSKNGFEVSGKITITIPTEDDDEIKFEVVKNEEIHNN